jgi:hypothetical protein
MVLSIGTGLTAIAVDLFSDSVRFAGKAIALSKGGWHLTVISTEANETPSPNSGI